MLSKCHNSNINNLPTTGTKTRPSRYTRTSTTIHHTLSYTPSPVLENSNRVLFWDRPVLTDKTIDHNRPDSLLHCIETKTALIIDIGVPLTHNIKKTEIEKQRKDYPQRPKSDQNGPWSVRTYVCMCVPPAFCNRKSQSYGIQNLSSI